MKKITVISSCFVMAFLSVGAKALDAPGGLVPAGLNPGDTFYIIFAGSTTIGGDQTAGTYVNYAATVKALDADTNAIAGWTTLFAHDDGTVTTGTAFTATDRPIYNTNGDKVGDDRTDLFDMSLDAAVGYNEQGTANMAEVWTGFNFNGNAFTVGDNTLGGNDSGTDGCVHGRASASDLTWAAENLAACTSSFGLYVLSPLLTVPNPTNGSSIDSNW